MSARHSHGDMKGKKLGISILLNLFITIAQAVGALASGSLSLLSDALHNFSDVIALIISYIADKLTKRDYTQQQTFGYKRAEVIAALINAVSLIGIGIIICNEALLRFNEPAVINSTIVIILAALSILVNGGSVLLIKKEAEDDMNIRSAYLHLLSDLFSSLAVLIGGIFMSYSQAFWIDSVLSIGIAIYLIYYSFELLFKTLRVVMQFSPSHISLKEIEKAVLQNPNIENIHHIHIWQLNHKEIHLEAHLDFNEDIKLSEASKIIQSMCIMLNDRFHIGHSILQPEFGLTDSKNLIANKL